jgi:small multidrug resistance family-3 protein
MAGLAGRARAPRQDLDRHRAVALGVYGFVATLQPDANFGRILAAYGGMFVARSLLWGAALDGFRPDRWDITGALICLVGVAVIMYAPHPA